MLSIHDVKLGEEITLNEPCYYANSGIIHGSIEGGNATIGGGYGGRITMSETVKIVAIADHRSAGKCDVFGEFKALVESATGLRAWVCAWQIVKKNE